MKKFIKKACTFTLATISLAAINAYASGIKVGLESTSDLGNQFAGGAALAGDASTNFYNAAGLTRIKNDQLVASFVGVSSYGQFSGTTFAQSTTTGGFGLGNFTGTGSASSRDFGIVPAFHYSTPIYDRTFLGVSVTTPYGLSDNYGDQSIVRYDVVHATAYSMNIGPSLAYQINDGWSVALGPDLMRFKLDLQTKVRTQVATTGDSYQDNNAYGWGWGGHAGVLYQPSDSTRFGLSYRSQVVEHLSGTSKFTGSGVVPSQTNANLQMDLTLPPMTMLSAYHAFNPQWAILGTVDYTQWSAFDSINVTNIAAPAPVFAQNYNAIQGYQNTWHAAVAGNYQMNDKYLFRAGVGMDQTSSRSAYANPANPGLGYYAVNVGIRVTPSAKMSIDGAYSHAFLRSASTSHRTALGAQVVTSNGRLRGNGDVFGIQFNWNLT